MKSAKLMQDIIITILTLFVFINCNSKQQHDDSFESNFTKNKLQLENVLESFPQYDKIHRIHCWGEKNYLLNNDRVKLVKPLSSHNNNSNEYYMFAAVQDEPDNDQRIDSNWFETHYNITSENFIKYAEFLHTYKIYELDIWNNGKVIRLVTHRGFVGESWGVIYVLQGNQDE